MTFGENLRRARKAAKVTQQAIADSFGISRVAVAQWESGRTMPETERIPQLAEIVHSSPDALFGKSRSDSETINPEDLLERMFALMADVEALPNAERKRFDNTLAAHHRLRELLTGKGKTK